MLAFYLTQLSLFSVYYGTILLRFRLFSYLGSPEDLLLDGVDSCQVQRSCTSQDLLQIDLETETGYQCYSTSRQDRMQIQAKERYPTCYQAYVVNKSKMK